tara:strand:- start:2011 stop:2484 length:474 start_codon:yes stop_codon:yes gene_type:complete
MTDKFTADSTDYSQKLRWVVVYQNGDIIDQSSGKELLKTDVLDHQKIYIFHLLNGNKPIFTLRLCPGQKFFYRARTAMKAGIGVLDRIHIVGWRKGDDKLVCFISESDLQVEIGDFVHKKDPYKLYRPWFYEVSWKDIDEHPISEITEQIEDTKRAS